MSLGHLKLYTERLDARTKAVHALTGADGAVTHQIEYHSVELHGLEEEIRARSKNP